MEERSQRPPSSQTRRDTLSLGRFFGSKMQIRASNYAGPTLLFTGCWKGDRLLLGPDRSPL